MGGDEGWDGRVRAGRARGWGESRDVAGARGRTVAVVVRLGVRETHVAHLEVAPHHLRRVEVDRAERRREARARPRLGTQRLRLAGGPRSLAFVTSTRCVIPRARCVNRPGRAMTATASASAAGDIPVKDMLPLGLKPQKICDMVRAGHPARPSASKLRTRPLLDPPSLP